MVAPRPLSILLALPLATATTATGASAAHRTTPQRTRQMTPPPCHCPRTTSATAVFISLKSGRKPCPCALGAETSLVPLCVAGELLAPSISSSSCSCSPFSPSLARVAGHGVRTSMPKKLLNPRWVVIATSGVGESADRHPER
ncbi:hypothetical protein HOY80DRAFT_974250 [Tuber brumale]|nr:hypothetical protein HOY80DRAFT_974250 [Tuber brumale]